MALVVRRIEKVDDAKSGLVSLLSTHSISSTVVVVPALKDALRKRGANCKLQTKNLERGGLFGLYFCMYR